MKAYTSQSLRLQPFCSVGDFLGNVSRLLVIPIKPSKVPPLLRFHDSLGIAQGWAAAEDRNDVFSPSIHRA